MRCKRLSRTEMKKFLDDIRDEIGIEIEDRPLIIYAIRKYEKEYCKRR